MTGGTGLCLTVLIRQAARTEFEYHSQVFPHHSPAQCPPTKNSVLAKIRARRAALKVAHATPAGVETTGFATSVNG
jgi:hypothetical protein